MVQHILNWIEFYVPKQLLGNPDKISLKAKTYYLQQCTIMCTEDTILDEFPSKPIEINNTNAPLISLYAEKDQYQLGETIKLMGYGFVPNKNFNYEFVNNLTNETLCERTVKSNSLGKINKKTCSIPSDKPVFGVYKIYLNEVFIGLFQISKSDLSGVLKYG